MGKTADWIAKITNDAPSLQVANKAGIPKGTYWRHIQDDKLTPENAVKIARAYGAPIAGALIATGLVNEDEIESSNLDHDIARALRLADDQQLAGEIMRRLKNIPEGQHETFDTPLSDL